MDPQAISLAGACISIGTLEMLYEKKIISLDDGRVALQKAMRQLGLVLAQAGESGVQASKLIASLQAGKFSAR